MGGSHPIVISECSLVFLCFGLVGPELWQKEETLVPRQVGGPEIPIEVTI